MIHTLMSAAHQARIRYGKRKTHFLGEVAAADLITGGALAQAIGLTAGAAQYSNEPWLHFELDGKTLYVAKKTYRHTISWNHINAVNAVYGSRTVEIQGKTYLVRLLKGANEDPFDGLHGDTPTMVDNSEWNRLIFLILAGRGKQPTYTASDLGIAGGNGSETLCQETYAKMTAGYYNIVGRGGLNVDYMSSRRKFGAYAILGWRPVLELVE